MRTSLLPLACLLVACGPSDEVEVTEAQRAEAAAEAGAQRAGEGPVDLGEGLVLTVLARGSGPFVAAGGRVRVHYTAQVVAVAEEPAVEPEEEPAEETGGEDDEAASGEGEAEEPQDDEAETEEAPAPEDEPSEDESDGAESLPRRFDSSRARGVPDVWDLSRTAQPRLIEGLRRGLVGLTAGSRVTLHVPAALAWGDAGLPAAQVPPRADLLYEIELIEVLQ